MDVFRPIHYLGSKLRVLKAIGDVVQSVRISNGPIVDLFSGSGTVSKYLSSEAPVVSVDFQEYSKIINSALLMPFFVSREHPIHTKAFNNYHKRLHELFAPLEEIESAALASIENGHLELIADILDLGPAVAISGIETINNKNLANAARSVVRNLQSNYGGLYTTVSEYYGGVFFSYRQAVFIDACINASFSLDASERNIFLAALLSTASDLANTVGKQFAQPINPRTSVGEIKNNIMGKIKKERSAIPELVFEKWFERYSSQSQPVYVNKVLCGEYSLAFQDAKNISVIYADPPYTRYHYSRYYHVLETIAKRDRPKITKSNMIHRFRQSRGVYRSDRYQSPFGIKSKAEAAFRELFKMAYMTGAPIILSYSPYASGREVTPRIQTIEKLIEMVSEFYRQTEVISCGKISHSKLNRQDLHLAAADSAELLIVGKN